MEKKRSVGVTISSTILLIIGLLMVGWVVKRTFTYGIGILNKNVFDFVILAQGILNVATSIGLYMLKDWMRKLCIFFSALHCVFLIPLMLLWIGRDIWLIFAHGCGGFSLAYAIWISPFVILRLYLLIFLTRPKVKEQFR